MCGNQKVWRMDGRTDRQTNEQMDKLIPIVPQLRWRGTIKILLIMACCYLRHVDTLLNLLFLPLCGFLVTLALCNKWHRTLRKQRSANIDEALDELMKQVVKERSPMSPQQCCRHHHSHGMCNTVSILGYLNLSTNQSILRGISQAMPSEVLDEMFWDIRRLMAWDWFNKLCP